MEKLNNILNTSNLTFDEFVANVIRYNPKIGNAYMGYVTFTDGLPENVKSGTMTVVSLGAKLIKYTFNYTSDGQAHQYECYTINGEGHTEWTLGEGGDGSNVVKFVTTIDPSVLEPNERFDLNFSDDELEEIASVALDPDKTCIITFKFSDSGVGTEYFNIPMDTIFFNETDKAFSGVTTNGFGQTIVCYIGMKHEQWIQYGIIGSDNEKDEYIIETTYKDLLNLHTFVPGMKYRITDYTCTTKQVDTLSAKHKFDIIVTAVSETELSETAKAVRHDGDTYFNGSNLDAWELKYTPYNDTGRFAWADASNGKGVIYYMKDEFGNECPYDFKNIKFFKNNEKIYTFDKYESGVHIDASIEGISPTSRCYNNIVKPYYSTNTRIFILNFITFCQRTAEYPLECYNNIFGNDCHDNSFGSNCYNNTFGSNCYENSFIYNCYNNTFGNDCHNNSFGYNCYNNTFGSNCNGNSFSENCMYNIVGDVFYNNKISSDFHYNKIGNSCNNNNWGINCYNNTFGNCCNNIIMTAVKSYKNFIFNDGVNNIEIHCSADNTQQISNWCFDNGFSIEGNTLPLYLPKERDGSEYEYTTHKRVAKTVKGSILAIEEYYSGSATIEKIITKLYPVTLNGVINYNSESQIDNNNEWVANNTDTSQNTYDPNTGEGTLYLNDGVDSIGGDLEEGAKASNINSPFFNNEKVRSVDMSNSGIKYISKHAFGSAINITSVVMPNTLLEIGNSAFSFCYSLSDITIPTSVTTIDAYAFTGCPINSIDIPSDVTYIDESAFSGGSTLNINYTGSSKGSPWGATYVNSKEDEQGLLYYYDEKIGGMVVVACKTTTKGTVEIPNTYNGNKKVLGIQDNAFRNCIGITNIIIPANVESFGKTIFEGCYNEKKTPTITSVTELSEHSPVITKNTFYNDPNIKIATLYVPSVDAMENYKKSEWTNFFSNISVTK